ncbi:hypothetical protein FHW79_004968 [Azospirillum sp. OGB3]|uniref:hypothetical protein n=1 Tax=Azospirillum sp. OGB3 TaxID=2587012 RepID=UPI0016065417|nr:hypothetical protein [Azospirillum sp. OGB3]MBB3267315.1 hypothetical protein [Azospirillum sp. OGB3]
MPDTLDATAPLLTIPDALASEAAAVLLGGDPAALKAVQEKLAAALTGQGLPEGAAGSVADGWMRDVAAGVGASATPDDAIAQASRIAAGTAARMAEAAQESAALTGEQRLAVALAQGQGLGQGSGPGGANDPKAASDLSAALFSGVMDPAARPAGAADPIAALSQALTAPPTAPAAADTVPVSPSDKLAAALASGVGVQDAVTALGPGAGGHFAEALEHALSSGADAAGAIAEAQALSAAGAVQTNSVAVEQTDGARLLGALAAGKTDGAGGNPAFTSVLNDALAQGAQPDAALGASSRAQTDMAARQEAAAVPAKPADALVASLSSGQNVAATVKTFAAAAGIDGAATGGFGEALGRALSSGTDMSGALGSAQQAVTTALALSAESAKGVKSDGLIAALASGQNVQQAVQALGGSGAAFNAALGQALADGRATGPALAAARQAAETVQQNAQGSEVPVSAENKALADLANPPPAGEAAKEGAKESGDKNAGEKAAEQVAEAPAEGKEGGEKEVAKEEDAKEDGAKEDGAKEDGVKEDAKGEAADATPAEGEASPAPGKSSMGSEPALKPISFDAAGTVKSADTAVPSATAPAPSTSLTPAAPPVTKTLTSDPFAVAAQIQQQVARAIEAAAATQPATVPPVAAPTLSTGFDAAAFAKALAIAEGTAAPAGFAVFHLIEAMFRPGEAGGSVIGVAVVANPDSPFGVWQYSLDGGAWLAVGAVGDGAALVLPDSALLRFLPAANWNGIAPSLGLRAVNSEWAEGFSGAEHRLFTLTGVGGTTPLSGDVAPLTLEVTPVNGAPVTTGAQAVLPAVSEDSADPAGAGVASLFGGLFSDPTDAVFGSAGNGFAGVAVVANPADAAQGQWQYWTGSAWSAVGAVSDGNALLLSADAKLRFVPATDWNGVPPSLMVRLIDDSQGPLTNGARADVTGAGGDSRYSLGTITLTTAVGAVNDAPVATGTTATLPTIAEDTTNPAGATVTSLFGQLFSDAADAVNGGSAANGFAGVVVVGNAATAAQGAWQYWTGTAWAAIGAASDSNGLLLSVGTALRFVPTANWNGTTPALTVRLVEDGGAPLITGNRVDLTNGVGGSTVYSAGTIALTGAVTPVNDAPVATGTTATLPTVAEDTANPTGTTVSSLFGHLFSDPADAVGGGSAANGFAGIAIVGNAATSQGVWQYWTGTAWAAVGAASDGNALLLAANTALRFVPAANWNGTTPALTVRLIDDSQGAVTSGGRVALASVGGDSRYSAGTVALTGTVTPVNDAPVATGAAATLPTLAEDAANPAGATVTGLFGHLFSDAVDAVSGGSAADTLAGVVVVGNAATVAQGAWQYWTGTAWADIGAVSGGNGLLLAANTALRFVPAANWNGTTPALTVRLVDTSHGPVASGARVDATSVGGSTAYSAGTIALTGTVTPVNDAPVATGTTATLPTIAEDTVNPTGTSVTALFAHLFSDPADAVAGGSSANGFAGVAIVGNAATAGQGVWQYWSGSAWITVGVVAEGAALVVAASALLRFVPAADWNGTTPALTVRLIEDGGAPVVTGGRVDLTTGVGGSTVYSADTIALTGTVTPVNDAPQITAGTTALATVKGVAVAVTGLSVSDVDAGALPMLVTLTAGHGTLTLAGAGWDADITGNGTDSVTIRATLATINGMLGAANGLLYTASAYTGADAIRIVVNDLGNGGAGGPLTATATIGVTVAPPNASPVLIDTNLDVAVAAEALAAPTAGTLGFAVSKLVGLNGSGPANVTDTDAGAVVGIALTGANESYGRWWFSTDNGATWSLVGTVNDSDSALLLRATDRLYFQPNAAVPATVNGALTIRAWDQTTGSAGSKAAVTLGAGSAFSAATDTVTLHPGVLIPNGTFDKGLTGWSYTGGATVGATGDGHEGTLTSAGGQSPTQLEDFLGLAHGSIAAATGTIPSFGNAMKLATTVTVTKDTTLTFDWTFIFSDPGYHDFAFVSVNGVVTLLAKDASASGKFSVVIPANTTLTLGFGTSDTSDNSVNPILRVDNVKLTTVASDPIVLDMGGDGLALRALTDGVLFDVSGDGVADRTGWVGKGNALLVRDDNQNGQIDDGRELVSEHFGAGSSGGGFNSSLEALASLDSNHDGRIDAADESFATLQVWQDADGDGVSRPGELRTLAEAGILSIATTATPSDATLAGNQILGTTSMTMADGSSRLVAGVAFDAQAAVAAQLHSQPLAASPSPFPSSQADHGRFDYAALISSGLGLPDNIPVAQSSQDTHNGDWAMALHTADTHHATTHASTIVPVAENS